jgi:hypothetical protein
MITVMLNCKGRSRKTKPALQFARDLAGEGLRARIKLAPSACSLPGAQMLWVLSKACLPKATDNIGAPP